jgi:subtilase family serine protease
LKVPFLSTVFLSFLISPTSGDAIADGFFKLPGHVPTQQIAHAQELGRKALSSKVQLAIVLSPSDPSGLASNLRSLYTPGDPLYHQFLTPAQFTARFAPSPQDLENVSQYLSSRGLSVTKTHSNNLIVDVEGSVSTVENAFQIELHDYLSADGRIVYSATSDPSVGDEVLPKVNAIVGLNNFSVKKPHRVKSLQTLNHSLDTSHASVSDYMTPSRIKSVYGLSSISQTGAGETLALFEMDGYTASDIKEYANYFSLASPTLSNVLVDGATGVPSTGDDSGANEVTLDIELAMALAPGLSKIIVYETPNTEAGLLDAYSRIATDNLANEVSTSWGGAENQMSASDFASENTIFQEMASQGQSFFASAGDSGAYDDSVDGVNTTLEVDDPASQPYVTGVGGTTLSWTSSNTWSSETSWKTTAASGTYGNSNYSEAEGGGGGVSRKWSIPSWQSGLSTSANKGSSSMRMVPDVSLNADPNSGYPIYYSGSWSLYGGTSCASPLWAGFTDLVNQQRVANGLSRLGFVNPSIYTIAKGAQYGNTFHDISDGSTNLYYPATSGYDLTTGLGSFNGSSLFNALAAAILAPIAPTSLAVTPSVLSLSLIWSSSGEATSYTLMRSTSSSGAFSAISTGLTSTNYTDTAVSYGTTYYYYVQAVNSSGTSAASAKATASPYPPAPGAPSGFSASVL